MSYWEAKAARNRALIASIHGGEGTTESTPGFDGGPMTDYMPRGEPRPLPPGDEPRELGWGEGVVIEDGARLLFFPWLAREDD